MSNSFNILQDTLIITNICLLYLMYIAMFPDSETPIRSAGEENVKLAFPWIGQVVQGLKLLATTKNFSHQELFCRTITVLSGLVLSLGFFYSEIVPLIVLVFGSIEFILLVAFSRAIDYRRIDANSTDFPETSSLDISLPSRKQSKEEVLQNKLKF